MEFKLSLGEHQASIQQAKSYTCSFCKRGFSNAQALGGHMNIHRKDRAKLKESSEENAKLELGEEKKVGAKEDCDQKVQKLYSFVETSSPQNSGETSSHVDGDIEKNEKLVCVSPNAELDLELRLGL